MMGNAIIQDITASRPTSFPIHSHPTVLCFITCGAEKAPFSNQTISQS
jgi:hypothetical protein